VRAVGLVVSWMASNVNPINDALHNVTRFRGVGADMVRAVGLGLSLQRAFSWQAPSPSIFSGGPRDMSEET
jgi:hypothetical protein